MQFKSLKFVLLFTSSLACSLSHADTGTQTPYKELSQIKGDEKSIYVFFSMTCTPSSEYDKPLENWGSTLPKGWKIKFVPLIESTGTTLLMARAYAVAEGIDNTTATAFRLSAYDNLLNNAYSPDSQATWLKIAKGAGITHFEQRWKSVDKAVIVDYAKKAVQYRINKTPTVAIAGRYLITPDDTNGDVETFFKLANGLISKSMY